MIEIRLNIKPLPKERPRATKTGHIYTPKKTADYERAIAKLVRHLPAQLGALEVEAKFVLKPPVKTPKSITGRFMKASSRGDLDNYVKALLDGCQSGGVIPNDSAVTRIIAEKVYGAPDERPHILLKIKPLGDLVLLADNTDAHAENDDEERHSIMRARAGDRLKNYIDQYKV